MSMERFPDHEKTLVCLLEKPAPGQPAPLILHFVCLAMLNSHRALVFREDQDHGAEVGGHQKTAGASALERG